MSSGGYIKLSGGTRAFLARPYAAPAKGIVILPSMPGTTPGFERIADDLAAEHEWSVCIPEIITEEPQAGFEERRLKVVDLVDEDVFAILRDAAAATEARDVALVGFCVGGMYAMKATSLQLFERIVAFYGMVRVPEYWRSPGQGEPLDYLRGNTDRLLAIFGEQDEFIATADIDALESTGVPVVRYPDAGHAFAHDGPHYREQDARDAWRRAIAFIAS